MNSQETFIAKFYPHQMLQKTRDKIKQLGINYPYQTIDLLNIRIFFCFFFFCSALILLPFGYILSPILTILLYFAIEYFTLDVPRKKRKKQLEEEAIFFFEILNLTLESKKNLLASLELTTTLVKGELSIEFQKVLSEIRLGKNMQEALKNMKARIPSSSIQQILLNMIAKETYGNNIVETIKDQVEYLREKRLQIAKSKIAKLPVKISLISMLFLIPLITLIILSPILLDYYFK